MVKKNLKIDRKKIQIYLEKKNIQTRVVFTGNILKQPGFRKIKSIKDKNGYPNADNVMRNGFLIAVHHGLNKKMINHIYQTFEKLFKKI